MQVVLLLLVSSVAGCRKSSTLSAQKAKEHVAMLARVANEDVQEVRRGLPQAAGFLSEYFAAAKFEDATAALEVLDRTRNKVQDLRVAKTTFLSLVDPQGMVIRSDQQSDLLAGKSLFGAFPELRQAASGRYVETRGEMEETAGVRGRKDGAWVAIQPVQNSGTVKGFYAGGWSWSAYAYRLENQLRSTLRGALTEREHEPLVYVYVVVDKDVFGAPISPEVNARAVSERHFDPDASGGPSTFELEITGREFGLAFQRVEALGKGVAIAVLRSET